MPVRRRKARLKTRDRWTIAATIVLAVVVLGSAVAGIVIAGLLSAVADDLPQLDIAAHEPLYENTYIYDGSPKPRLLAVLRGEESRVIVGSDEIAEVVKQATVAIEDRRFFSHEGVDYTAIARALFADIEAGDTVQGGSTITQQFIKNAYLPEERQTERTFSRKVHEAALALQLERTWSKDQILTNYLNTIYFGQGAYGIEMAARTYFGRHADDLTVAQAALLAGLVRHPSDDDPILHPDRARQRRRLVLDGMVELGFCSEAEADAAAREPLPRTARPIPVKSDIAPYYVSYVIQQLVRQFGPEVAFGGGLRVYTALDPGVQRAANAATHSILDRRGDPAAALVAIDPRSGEIKAMVGGRDFSRQQFNVATQGHRQPGSAFKTFALVAALRQRVAPQSVFYSAPKTIDMGEGSDPWIVSTYSGGYSGPVTLFDATVYSDNTVYADLSMMVGPENIAAAAHTMGIGSSVGANPSIALGGLTQGVTPLEMASAYTTLATGGQRVVGGEVADGEPVPIAIRRVTDSGGETLFRNSVTRQRVMPQWQAGLVTSILQQAVLRGTGTAAYLGRPCAGKTGTTTDYKDAWFCGYTPDLVAAVWVGYVERPRPLVVRGIKVAGGTFPATIWRQFMASALTGTPAHTFPSYQTPPVEKAIVCSRTGELATKWCPERIKVYFFNGILPERTCRFHKPRSVAVPDVRGMTVEQAGEALRRLNLEWKVEWVLSASAEQGIVLEQTPPPGTMQSQAEPVRLRAGSGPNRIVPNVIGLCREQAEDLVAAAGFVYRVEFDGGYSRLGFVIEQSPEGGSSAQGEVVITVGGRREDVPVPAVTGMTLGEARSRLNAQGFGVVVEGPDVDTALVTGSLPAEGVRLLNGSLVTLTTQ